MKKHGKSPAVGEGLLCAKSRPDGAPTLDNTIAGLVDLDANGLVCSGAIIWAGPLPSICRDGCF